MKNKVFIIRTLIEMTRPILKGTVLFRSFNGQYNDNPKYVCEELHRRRPNVSVVWAVGDGKRESFPPYATLVDIDSPEYARYIARSAVVVDNYCGCRTNYIKKNSLVKRLVFWILSRRKRGQLRISTWHGTPLKRIALDEPQYKNAEFSRGYISTDVILAGSLFSAKAFRSAFRWDGEILAVGTPRNDILVNGEHGRIKKKLGLPEDKKILLFAPTFRNDVLMSGVNQLRELNVERILLELGRKFGGEWQMVFRCHNLVMKEIMKMNILSEDTINGNACEDMAEYLLAADALLTDYSSSMFDFMLTGRPVFLYTPDIADYRDGERGFYLDVHDLPFPVSQTPSGVIDDIRSFDKTAYAKATDDFLALIGNCETGGASGLVADKIIMHLEEI